MAGSGGGTKKCAITTLSPSLIPVSRNPEKYMLNVISKCRDTRYCSQKEADVIQQKESFS